MKQCLITLFISLLIVSNIYSQNNKNSKSVIHFNAEDGVKITADLYLLPQPDAPIIILYHQARFSRGEYKEIAPKLNKLGFSCIAIDQRSGNEVNNVVNQTHLEAVKLKKATEYIDAIPDVEAALRYVKKNFTPKKVIIWGSSYSSSLVLYMGGKYPDDVNGILAFSPGEYFKVDNKEIKIYASKIKSPVFITSAKKEKEHWQDIYDSISSDKQYYLPETEGKHGSKALWVSNNGHQGYWDAVTSFLKKFK
ncbi:MAG: alpha/beta hydrolase [Bacteroidota bacterium]